MLLFLWDLVVQFDKVIWKKGPDNRADKVTQKE